MSQQERTVRKMKRTQKSTSEGRSIEAVREKLSSLTPETFWWALLLEKEEVCVSFFTESEPRGCFELRAKNWEGLLQRITAVDWKVAHAEAVDGAQKLAEFFSEGVQS
ncbi:MAG: hypothetical protein IPP19_13205 [Verrucomicrobia bacterium]|nr:hypothetical protein [Verrucomicrobiota bacterium]